MLIDAVLTPANYKVPEANTLYDDLLDYVRSTYSDYPPSTQAIIFALSYANQCRLKKLEAFKIFAKHGSLTRDCRRDIATATDTLRNADYQPLCRNARESFEWFTKETYIALLNDVDRSIEAKVKSISDSQSIHFNQIEESLSSIESAIAAQKVLLPAKAKEYSLAVGFLIDSSRHAVLILASAAWLLLLGGVIRIVAPGILLAIGHVIEESLKFIRG